MAPLSRVHSFRINLNRLVLPVPFLPTMPTLCPVGMFTDALSKSGVPPIANESFFILSINDIKKF